MQRACQMPTSFIHWPKNSVLGAVKANFRPASCSRPRPQPFHNGNLIAQVGAAEAVKLSANGQVMTFGASESPLQASQAGASETIEAVCSLCPACEPTCTIARNQRLTTDAGPPGDHKRRSGRTGGRGGARRPRTCPAGLRGPWAAPAWVVAGATSVLRHDEASGIAQGVLAVAAEAGVIRGRGWVQPRVRACGSCYKAFDG